MVIHASWFMILVVNDYINSLGTPYVVHAAQMQKMAYTPHAAKNAKQGACTPCSLETKLRAKIITKHF